jgi:hypothetical protein
MWRVVDAVFHISIRDWFPEKVPRVNHNLIRLALQNAWFRCAHAHLLFRLLIFLDAKIPIRPVAAVP